MQVKNISRLVLLLLAALSVQSCTSTFELDEINASQKLVVYCMPVAGRDTTIIQLSKSIPVNMAGIPPQGLPDANIDFTVNGKSYPAQWNQEKTSNLPAQCYYVVTPIREGDTVSITADADGLPTVSSATQIPAPPIVDRVELSYKHSYESGDLMQTSITFTDTPSADNYYGVRIISRRVKQERYLSYLTGEWVYATDISDPSPLTADLTDEPLLNNQIGLDETLELDYDYCYNLYIWDDKRLDSPTYTLRLNSYYFPSSIEESPEFYHKRYDEYKIYFYHLTPEFYRYLKSVNDIYNNELGKNGLAPIRSHYSNVEGGIGLVGGCQLLETDWIQNPDETTPSVWQP